MEEISLKEIIEIFLKGKWIIAIITAVCILVAGIASFFFMSPKYEAETMLMISPIGGEIKTTDSDSIKGLVSALAQYPVMTIDTYKEQVKTPEVLEYIKSEAGLDDLSLNQIASKIKVNSIDKTNILTITASDTDPEMAAKLANIASQKFTSFVSDTNKRQAEKSAEFIKTEQEKEKQRLDEAQEALKDFLAQPRGPEELKQELGSRLNQITSFKTQIANVEINEQIVEEKLKKAKLLLESTPKHIEVYKTLSDDDVMMGVVRDSTGQKIADIAGLTMTEYHINEAYVNLVSTINEYEISLAEYRAQKESLNEKIAEGQKAVEEIQADLAQKQRTYDELTHQYNLTKQTYDAYQQKYKEAMIKQSAEIGKQSIIVVSKAVTPESPVSPNKKLNLAIAAVLGLMIGAFVVFFREYWINAEEDAAPSL